MDSPYDFPRADSVFDDDDSHASDVGVQAMPKQGSALPAVRKWFSCVVFLSSVIWVSGAVSIQLVFRFRCLDSVCLWILSFGSVKIPA